MRSSKFSLLIILGITSMLFLNVCIMNGQSLSVNGDPLRIVDTDLEYSFPNGSLFVYKQNVNLTEDTIDWNGSGYDTDNDSESFLGYDLIQPVITSISNVSANITDHYYSNLTNVPSYPIQLYEWDYDGNQTVQINNTLTGLLNGYFFYPHDVFVNDLIQNDDSFGEASLQSYFETYNPVVYYFLYYYMFKFFASSGNITITSQENDTVSADATAFDGGYIWDYNIGGIINNIFGMTGMIMNLSFTMGINMSMNCYHVVDEYLFLLDMSMKLTNASATWEYSQIDLGIDLAETLDYSTLLSCAAGFEMFGEEGQTFAQNWLWIVLAALGAIAVTLIIAILVQRSSCDNVQTPLDHFACRIGNKYKENPKK